jgi:hypothetical protein
MFPYFFKKSERRKEAMSAASYELVFSPSLIIFFEKERLMETPSCFAFVTKEDDCVKNSLNIS